MGGSYYADLGGSRILSITAGTDHSAADDANVVDWVKTDEFIIAMNIHSSGKDTVASTYNVQWQDDASPGYVDLNSDGATPKLSYTIADASWADGAEIATGDQKCDSQGGDTRIVGERVKNSSLSDSIDLADEQQSELWFGVNSDSADDGATYSFQLYSTAEGAAIGVAGATLTILAGATTYYQNTGQGSVAIVGALKKKTSKKVGEYAISISGTLTEFVKSFSAVGGGSVAITGTLDSIGKFKRTVGGYVVAIVGALSKKTSKGVGDGSVSPVGSLNKKTTKDVGAHAVISSGSLGAQIKVGSIVGGGSVVISGILTSVGKFKRTVGEHIVSIVGVLKKKTSKKTGQGSVSSAGVLNKKTTKTTGGHAVILEGSLDSLGKFKKPAGDGVVISTGSLDTQWAGALGGLIFMVIKKKFMQWRE